MIISKSFLNVDKLLLMDKNKLLSIKKMLFNNLMNSSKIDEYVVALAVFSEFERLTNEVLFEINN